MICTRKKKKEKKKGFPRYTLLPVLNRPGQVNSAIDVEKWINESRARHRA